MYFIVTKEYVVFHTLASFLKGQSSDILIPVFFTYMDRPSLNKNHFWFYNFCRGLHNFRSKKILFTLLRRKPFGKVIFSDNFNNFISGFPRFLDVLTSQNHVEKPLLLLLNCFGNLFLKHRKVSENR
jgi:hypothetical protein